MLFKIKIFSNLVKGILIVFLLTLVACEFKPVYKKANILPELCSIKIQNEKNSAPLYEIKFKNELQYILCDHKIIETKYILNWEISKNNRELIKSESTSLRRYEETLLVKFTILDANNQKMLFSDNIKSKGAYNILEDDIVSTITSKTSVNSDNAENAARLVLDKVYLFILKQ